VSLRRPAAPGCHLEPVGVDKPAANSQAAGFVGVRAQLTSPKGDAAAGTQSRPPSSSVRSAGFLSSRRSLPFVCSASCERGRPPPMARTPPPSVMGRSCWLVCSLSMMIVVVVVKRALTRDHNAMVRPVRRGARTSLWRAPRWRSPKRGRARAPSRKRARETPTRPWPQSGGESKVALARRWRRRLGSEARRQRART
jgi:hypothetical protein